MPDLDGLALDNSFAKKFEQCAPCKGPISLDRLLNSHPLKRVRGHRPFLDSLGVHCVNVPTQLKAYRILLATG